MDHALLARWRMRSQLVWGRGAARAADVVGRLAAAQGQDLLPASWGLAQRAGGLTLDGVRAELDAGTVLRTHVLRPTWHFVVPADVRWLLVATAPRVQQRNGPIYRQAGLDDETRAATRRVVAAALADGHHRTRAEIGESLAAAGYALAGQSLAYVLMDAELAGVVTSGAARGSRQTYALLDERAPGHDDRTREEALAELARRYLATRGPATADDLAGWASLSLTEARRATAAAAPELESFDDDGTTWWHAPGDPPAAAAPRVDLVQGLDELVMSYSRTRAVLTGDVTWFEGAPVAMSHAVLVDGRVAGRWGYERDGRGRPARVVVRPLRAWTAGERDGVDAAVRRFGRFVGGEVTWSAD